MSASFTADLDAVARPWLKALASRAARAANAAPLWLLADVPAAIAFAAGLAPGGRRPAARPGRRHALAGP